MELKAKNAHWHPDSPATPLLAQDPTSLSKEELLLLITELDRRFMQLWDKVVFEQKMKYVSYGAKNCAPFIYKDLQ